MSEYKVHLKSKKFAIDLLWEPRDLWVGVYWDRGQHEVHYIPGSVMLENYVRVYVCLLPCLPIKLSWSSPVRGLR